MSTGTYKFAPLSLKVQNIAEKNICLCRTLATSLGFCRLLGLFPVAWEHKNKCVYKYSLFWLFYTALIVGLHMFIIISSIDYADLIKQKSLLLILNYITNAIYEFYVIILTVIVYIKFPAWIESLNNLSPALREGISCQSSRQIISLLSYVYIAVFMIVAIVQTGILFWLHKSSGYETNFDIIYFLIRLSQNIPFVFYLQFFTFVSMMTGVLACFEKLTISVLRDAPVYPMKCLDVTNNESDLFGIVYYKLCKNPHPCPPKLLNIPSSQLVEHLRILHEDISLCIYSFNGCMDPQLLLHTVIELIILIIHWYAVIAYMIYTFKNPLASAIHVLNCVFVVLHTIGLFLFLKNAQHLKNMILGLTDCLLEYSTRISTLEEHRQVRIFIEKLKQHRPFTASGVFTIELGIAGPISANILTYVLVALQFETPEE